MIWQDLGWLKREEISASCWLLARLAWPLSWGRHVYFESSTDNQLTARFYIPEDRTLHTTYCHVMDDWINCTLYIHITRDYRQYSAIAILHTLQFTVAHALRFSGFTSRILATDFTTVSLSLQITHKVFFSQPSSFLAIILRLQIPQTWLRLASRNSTLHFRLLISTLLCRVFCFLITSRDGPHRKRSLYCSWGKCTAPLPSNRRPITARVRFAGMCLPSLCLAIVYTSEYVGKTQDSNCVDLIS
jgi:hypothetical protein